MMHGTTVFFFLLVVSKAAIIFYLSYTAKIGYLLYKCSYFLCAVYKLAYVWPTFKDEINM